MEASKQEQQCIPQQWLDRWKVVKQTAIACKGDDPTCHWGTLWQLQLVTPAPAGTACLLAACPPTGSLPEEGHHQYGWQQHRIRVGGPSDADAAAAAQQAQSIISGAITAIERSLVQSTHNKRLPKCRNSYPNHQQHPTRGGCLPACLPAPKSKQTKTKLTL